MTIITLDNSQVEVIILSDSIKQKYLQDFNGKQDNSIRKQWTSRTFRLSDNRLIVEFYDKQGALVNSLTDFEKLNEVRFTKNYIDFLKKNISYKIETAFEKGIDISKGAKRISNIKSESLEYADFEVYELSTGQILFINKFDNSKSATIYENMKGLCSDNNNILSQYYQGMEEWSAKLINGDPLFDYEPNEQLVYPKDIPDLIKNHKLTKIESKVFVKDFYGNLYKSDNDYYVLIDEVNQKNGAGIKMPILTIRIYEKLQDVRDAQAKYEKSKNRIVSSEHFYQKISDKYGKDFLLLTSKLIELLPLALNFDREKLTFDSNGMAIVDEAIHWNHANHKLFEEWYPCVLAYYGQCYMVEKKDGKWIVKKDKEYNVLIPHLVLSNGDDAFDMRDFYSDLYEWPIPIKWAGDWDGTKREMKKSIMIQNSR